MLIEKRFLVFPICRTGEETLVTFMVNGKLVYDLNMRLTTKEADFYAFVDMSRFRGQEVTIAAADGILPAIRQTDDWDDRAPLCPETRPLLHFAPRNGWNNDPNGLVYANGTYHMFFQHNPCDVVWGNMHWGHATSTDLVHWQEQETALFPDELGVMFSGSAMVDERNLLGLKQDDTDVILLFYTAEPISQLAKGRQTTQCLAYSTDNGKTFVKYPRNPIVPTIVNGNRDPKVQWDEASQRYVMALYLDTDRYAILHSTDLLHWNKAQELHLEGDNECPDLLLMTADDGAHKAVMGGAHGLYQVGDLVDGRFVPTQPMRYLYLNEYCYAHQTYSGIPGRTVQVTWHRANVEGAAYSQELSFPCELSLHRQGDAYQLRILPARELDSLIERWSSVEDPQADAISQLIPLPCLIRLQPREDARLTLTLGNQTLLYDAKAQTITSEDVCYTLPADAASCDMLLLVDRNTLKLHLCGGAALLALPVRWTGDAVLTLSTEAGKTLPALEIARLKSVQE